MKLLVLVVISSTSKRSRIYFEAGIVNIVEPDVLVLSKKFLNSKIFCVFLKNYLLLTKPAFI